MWRAHARQAARHDLAAFGHELPEQPVVLVVDVFDFLGAELADFLSPEKFPSAAALARRTAWAASATTESRTISARPSTAAFTRPRPLAGRGLLLWCFRIVSHNSP